MVPENSIAAPVAELNVGLKYLEKELEARATASASAFGIHSQCAGRLNGTQLMGEVGEGKIMVEKNLVMSAGEALNE